jgi:hypothetical protein
MNGWERIVGEFTALGGVADNVRAGEGPLGRGLFAIDPSQAVRLRAPNFPGVRGALKR